MALPNIGIQITKSDMTVKRTLLTETLTRLHAPLLVGNQEIEQAIAIRLMTRLGEDPIEPTMGLPVKTIIAANNDAYTEAAIRACIKQDPRVDSVPTIQLTHRPEARILEVSFKVLLKDGSQASGSATIGGI